MHVLVCGPVLAQAELDPQPPFEVAQLLMAVQSLLLPDGEKYLALQLHVLAPLADDEQREFDPQPPFETAQVLETEQS